MEYYRQQYRGGVIDTKTYDKMIEIVSYLEEKNYTFLEELGFGSFGSVLKVKDSSSNEEHAVKIVSKDQVSKGETELWSTLDHENILSLLSSEYVYFANSYIFVTPVHRMNLEEAVLKSSLLAETDAFDEAVVWMKDILSGVEYMHEKNLCHLDLKGNNVLLTQDKRAVIADFGFLSSTEKNVQRYGCPFIYRCPQARMTESGLTEVNGKSFDIFAIGTMAFELFTGMALLREASKWDSLVSWHAQVYPVLQDCLQKQRLIELMCKTFPTSKNVENKADDVISFVTSCLTIVPEKRPNAHQLLDHRLFGGVFQNVLLEPHEDIWSKLVSALEFNSIFERNPSEDNVPERIAEEGGNSRNIITESADHDEKADDLKVTDPTLQNSAIDKTENTDDPSFPLDKVRATTVDVKPHFIEKSQTETLSPPVTKSSSQHSNIEINYNNIDAEFHLSELDVTKSGQSIVSTAEKSDLCVTTPQPSSTEISQGITTPSDNSSIQPSSTEINKCITAPSDNSSIQSSSTEINKGSTAPSDNSPMKVPSPDTTQKQSFGQNIRSWWKKRKTRLVRIFSACMCCAKSSSTDEK